MDKYFTFFLCSTEWSQPERVLVFVDWLIQALPLKGKLVLIAREASATHSRKPAICGDYFRCRKKLERLSLHTLLISNRVWKESTTEVFVFFNRVHYTLDYAQGSRPSSSGATLVKTEVPEAIKAFTVSIRLDIWKKCEKNGISAALAKEMESLFVALSCISGYGHATPLPVGGTSNLIRGSSEISAPRIQDFDYTQHIERVCRINYLSSSLLNKVPDERRLHIFGDGVECRDLRDASGARAGVAIYLKQYSQEEIHSVNESLGSLVWTPKT